MFTRFGTVNTTTRLETKNIRKTRNIKPNRMKHRIIA